LLADSGESPRFSSQSTHPLLARTALLLVLRRRKPLQPLRAAASFRDARGVRFERSSVTLTPLLLDAVSPLSLTKTSGTVSTAEPPSLCSTPYSAHGKA
jgi:hypothetical protein